MRKMYQFFGLLVLILYDINVVGCSHSNDTSPQVAGTRKRIPIQLPDIVLQGVIILKIKSIGYIRELANRRKPITKKLTFLCEKEMKKLFDHIKGKQIAKIGSIRRSRRNKAILVIDLDSTGNGNASEISEIIERNIRNPGKFLYYEIDKRMATFRSHGVCCQPRVHYSFNNHGQSMVYDYSGYDNNGLVSGKIDITTRGRCGKGGRFKNSYSTLRKYKQRENSGTDSIAIIFWIRVDSAKANSSILRGHYQGAVTEVLLYDGYIVFTHILQDESTVFRIVHDKPLKPRVWTHIACIYDPYIHTVKLYINAELSKELVVPKDRIKWRFDGWLRFGMPNTHGYLDDLYLYDCILGEDIINSIRRTCSCKERCSPRGNNQFLIRMKLSRNKDKKKDNEIAEKVEKEIEDLFNSTMGTQQVQILGFRPVDVDQMMVDYSLHSVGNSDMNYLAGILQPAIIAGKLSEVSSPTSAVTFAPLTGKGVCRSNEVKCRSGECINKLWKCDGEINCADGDDEANCGVPLSLSCNHEEFSCNKSRILGISDCVSTKYHCDGQLDCEDDSDEQNCREPKLVTAPRSLTIVAESETASCNCAAHGVPTPVVTWHKNGRGITPIKDKITVTSMNGHGTLTIFHLKQQDSGDYICKIRDNKVEKVVAPSCTIIVRAFGNVCTAPFFNSIAQTNRECIRCFCHHKTNDCQSAELYRTKLSTLWRCLDCVEDEQSELVGENGRILGRSETRNLMDGINDETLPYFWKLPQKYSGNKLTSYGGTLSFTRDINLIQNKQSTRRKRSKKTGDKIWNYIPEDVIENGTWYDDPSGGKTVNNVPAIIDIPLVLEDQVYTTYHDVPRAPINLSGGHEVVITGKDGSRITSAKIEYLSRRGVAVKIHEDSWKIQGKNVFVTREQFLEILSDIQDIYINAKDTKYTISRLLNVSMEIAVANGDQRVVMVEQCACPVGYDGLSCEKCSRGYYLSKRSNTCLKCSCSNHSFTCDTWTGECKNCLHSTTGPYCQYCLPGFYGNATVGTTSDCKQCKCPLGIETNQFSKLCHLDKDGEQTCTRCQHGYTGRNCEKCAKGFAGNPMEVGESCYRVGDFTECDMEGSISQNVTEKGDIRCICKANVIGSTCNECRSGTFNLHASNPSGCERCFCNRVSRKCTNMIGVKNTITTNIDKDFFTLTEIRSIESFSFTREGQNSYAFLQRVFSKNTYLKKALYWKLPAQFTGSKVGSYGSYLEYTVTYKWGHEKAPTRTYDVIILGKQFGIVHVGRKIRRIDYENNRKQTFRVLLQERFWRFASGSSPSKHLFLVFLAQIQDILILATPKQEMKLTRLHKVAMETVVEQENGIVFPRVETCSCPRGYTGHSCEFCAEGYTLASSGLLPRCTKCICYGHSSKCDLKTGKCQDCGDNTTGNHCEKCKPGYYGNPMVGAKCQPCPCPYTTPPNRFSFTCSMDVNGSPICDDCPEGYEGERCERCNATYVGNPMVIGDTCKPVSSCGCDARGSQDEKCHDKTRKCSCKSNVHGEKCTKCKPGYFNLQKDNPVGCTKCFCMGQRIRCRSQQFYREPIKFKPSSIHEIEGLSITSKDLSESTTKFIIDRNTKRIRFIDMRWLQRTNIYWKMPKIFLGNQVSSYGGILMFSYFYSAPDSHFTNGVHAVQIQGVHTTLYYKDITYIASNIVKDIEVVLSEENWLNEHGSSVSREEFLKVLIHIRAILVKASYSKRTTEMSIGDMKMNVYPRSNGRQVNALEVEICNCPNGYKGTSCESCSDGFTKNNDIFGSCVLCQCNGHSEKCDPQTGVCQDCRDDTAGDHCELCVKGFYDLGKKTQDCKPCLCPLSGTINRFSDTCFLDEDGSLTCDACQEGYTGRRCEKCSLNYTGNPLTPGGKCIQVPVELIPKVTIVPNKITIQENDGVQFVCHVTSRRPTQIVWSRQDGESLPNKITVKGNTLTITKVKKSDKGVYVCAAYSDIAVRTARAELLVKDQVALVKVNAVIITVSPKSRYIPVGGTAKFTCSSSTVSKYSIKWSRENGRALPATTRVRHGTMVITNAKMEDGGTYICTGRNILNTDRAIVSLHVGVVMKPQVAVSPRIQIVDIAEEVTFRCFASAGFPAPVLRWQRGGTERVPRFSKFVNGLFKIIAASRRDEGEYRCIASNSGGKSVMDVKLLVKGPNSVPRATVTPSKITIDEGEGVFLKCDVTGDAPLEVTWRKDGGKLPKYVTIRGKNLTIKNSRVDDQGAYICSAVNRYGRHEVSAKVTVKKDMSKELDVFIKPESSLITVMLGRSLTLYCQVNDTTEEVTFKWERLTRGEIMKGAILDLGKMKLADTGIYICRASTINGEEGQASVSVLVKRINSLPQVDVYPNYREAKRGNRVILTCTARSETPMIVSWVKPDGTTASRKKTRKFEKTMTFTIASVNRGHEGTYLCIATNLYGSSKATTDLNVY